MLWAPDTIEGDGIAGGGKLKTGSSLVLEVKPDWKCGSESRVQDNGEAERLLQDPSAIPIRRLHRLYTTWAVHRRSVHFTTQERIMTPRSADTIVSQNPVFNPHAAGIDVGATEMGPGGASSLVIVPCPWPSAIVATVAPERFTKNVSFTSLVVSPFTTTVIVCVDAPGAKVSVPDVET